MRITLLVALGFAIALLADKPAQARVSHGYSGIFSIDIVTAVPDQANPPNSTAISVIYPNPFNPLATIEFKVAVTGPAKLMIFDLRGRLIRVVESGIRPIGNHQATWDGRDGDGCSVPSGTYFCRLDTPQGSQIRKLTLAR